MNECDCCLHWAKGIPSAGLPVGAGGTCPVSACLSLVSTFCAVLFAWFGASGVGPSYRLDSRWDVQEYKLLWSLVAFAHAPKDCLDMSNKGRKVGASLLHHPKWELLEGLRDTRHSPCSGTMCWISHCVFLRTWTKPSIYPSWIVTCRTFNSLCFSVCKTEE